MKKCSAKPYDGNEKYIFVSYCHKDKAQVFPIIEQMAKDGYRVWYDEGINPGSEWPETIASHLSKCAICMAFITENALNSHNCRREINFALMKTKKLISVILEPVEMSLGMEMQLSATQSIFKYKLSGTDEFFGKLYSAYGMNACKGAPDNTITVSAPEDYEEEIIFDKRESFSDRWFVEDISDNKKPPAFDAPTPENAAIMSSPAQYTEPQPAQYTEPQPAQYAEPQPAQYTEPLPAQYAEPLPAQYAEPQPAQYTEPLPAQSEFVGDALFANSRPDSVPLDGISAAEGENAAALKAIYTADDEDVDNKKKLPLWIKISALAAVAVVLAAIVIVLLFMKPNGDGQTVYVSESGYSDESSASSDSSMYDERSSAYDTSTSVDSSEDSIASAPKEDSSAGSTQTDSLESTLPKWEETEFSGVKYVTEDCYSRKAALLGSETAGLYKQGSSVTIIAVTDTGYYKLEDGSFIHEDYLSDVDPSQSPSQPQTEKPSDTQKPSDTKRPSETQKPAETQKPQTQNPVTDTPQTQKPTESEGPDYEKVYALETLNDGTLSIVSYDGSDSDLVIPETINGKRVTEIGEWAFHSNYTLTSVTLPSGVTYIGDEAFIDCKNLKHIKLSKNLLYIGDSAFKDCVSLPSIDLPDGLFTIERRAFSYCSSLKSLVIPDSVIELGGNLFEYCDSLTSVTLSKNLKTIDVGTFAYCKKLSSLELPENISSVLDSAFSQSPNLKAITVDKNNKYFSSQDGVLFNKDKTLLIRCPEGKSGEYKIPDSVVTIEDFALDSCTKLTSVVFPKSLRWIGESAFIDCKNISDVYYQGSLDDWYKLLIETGNELLYDAVLHTE